MRWLLDERQPLLRRAMIRKPARGNHALGRPFPCALYFRVDCSDVFSPQVSFVSISCVAMNAFRPFLLSTERSVPSDACLSSSMALIHRRISFFALMMQRCGIVFCITNAQGAPCSKYFRKYSYGRFVPDTGSALPVGINCGTASASGERVTVSIPSGSNWLGLAGMAAIMRSGRKRGQPRRKRAAP